MLMCTHLIGFGVGSSAVQTQIPQGTGTPIGDMTSNGGLAAAFDGTTSQAYLSSAYRNANQQVTYVGKDWGGGGDKIVTGFRAYGSNDRGFKNNADTNITITLYGKATSPSSATDGTSLGSVGPTTDSNGLMMEKLTGITTTTAYRYHWLVIDGSNSSDSNICAECLFFENV